MLKHRTRKYKFIKREYICVYYERFKMEDIYLTSMFKHEYYCCCFPNTLQYFSLYQYVKTLRVLFNA